MTDTLEPATRVRALIDEHTSTGPYTPRIVAAEIVQKLRETEPEVLTAWLDEHAEHFVWSAINRIDGSRRAYAVQRSKSAVFREVSEAAEGGDAVPIRRFLDSPYTIEDGTRWRLADLKHDDLVFVADSYEDRARANAMCGAFMRALSRKVKGQSAVSDRFTEEQLTTMWNSLTS